MPGPLRDPSPRALRRLDRGLVDRGLGGAADPESTADEYADWSVAELRRRAAELGVVGGSRMRRDELVAALRRG